MGCMCSKGIDPEENVKTNRTKSLKRFFTLPKKEEVAPTIANVPNNRSHGISARVVPKPVETVAVAPSQFNNRSHSVSARVVPKPVETVTAAPPQFDDQKEGKQAAPATDRTRKGDSQQRRVSAVRNEGPKAIGGTNCAETINLVPNSAAKEHIAAGWPSWLISVAEEAVKGWLPRRASTFEKLEKIGQGTYSSVYKARDLETGKFVALKKVRFVNMDPESVRFMAREIHILRKLDHPNVMKLEGIITSHKSPNLYLVFEYMEHDLTGLAARPGTKFTEPQVKCFMRQLLEGLAHCHSRGILHRDIKGSNLFVDSNGILKIGDFGLANIFNPYKKQPLTSRVVTLWYRPPELLLGATEYGVAVDLWSAGCILAELLVGKAIMPGRTEVEQLHKIFKLCGSPSDDYWNKSKLPNATIFKPHRPYRRCLTEVFNHFPPSTLSLLDTLLAVEPDKRGTAALALRTEYFTTAPLACDPSSLPKFPPSKEYDAKLREEEAIRRKIAAAHILGSESVKPGTRGSKKVPGPDADAEMKVFSKQVQASSKSKSAKYFAEDDGESGFPINPPGTMEPNGSNNSRILSTATSMNSKVNVRGQMVPALTYSSSVRVSTGAQLKTQRSFAPNSEVADFTNFPSSAVPRRMESSRYDPFDVVEPSEKNSLDRCTPTYQKNEAVMSKESTSGHGNKNKRIHYSGPLLPPGGNMEEMLREHERQIQQAVRKARQNKIDSKKKF